MKEFEDYQKEMEELHPGVVTGILYDIGAGETENNSNASSTQQDPITNENEGDFSIDIDKFGGGDDYGIDFDNVPLRSYRNKQFQKN